MMTSIQESDQNNKLLLDSFHRFYQLCHVDSLLKRCRIEKKRGASTEEIFRFVFQLRLQGRICITGSGVDFCSLGRKLD